jgi:hypothetical protein
MSKLADKIKELMEKKQRSAGVLDDVKKRLRSEFGISIEEAPEKLRKLESERRKLLADIEKRTQDAEALCDKIEGDMHCPF